MGDLLSVVIFVVLLGKTLCTSDEEQTKSLYSADDPILQLSVNDFNQSVYMKNKAFFIEFYSSWCGHCIHFAPVYKQFASNVSKWSDFVQVGAINCALDANLPMCQDHGVEAYPTIKYFKYLSRGADAGEFYANSKHTVDLLVTGLAQLVADDQRKHVPSGWPNLSPVNDKTDVNQLWAKENTNNAEYLAIVVDHFNETSMGPQIVLDFFSYRSKILVKIVTDKNPLTSTHSVVKFPGLVIFKKNNPVPFFVSKSALSRQEMITKIKYHADLQIEVDKIGQVSKQPAVAPVVRDVDVAVSPEKYSVHKNDLISSIVKIFYHEVAKFKIISHVKLSTLKAFLETLSRYFPGNDSEKQFLFRLISWLNENRDEITRDQWQNQLQLIQVVNESNGVQ